MSILSRIDSRVTAHGLQQGAALAEHARQPDRYLTDGVDLYRSLGAVPSAMGQMVALENCHSLDVILLPIGELHSRSLRVVIPDVGGID